MGEAQTVVSPAAMSDPATWLKPKPQFQWLQKVIHNRNDR